MPTVSQIQFAVAQEFRVPVLRLVDHPTRGPQEYSFPRQIAMYLAKRLTGHSRTTIGRLFAGRDHSTVGHAINVVSQMLLIDERLAEKVQRLEETLAGMESVDLFFLRDQQPEQPVEKPRKRPEMDEEDKRIRQVHFDLMRCIAHEPKVRLEDRVYRDPCFRCGARGDIGCVHTRVAA